MKANTLFVYHHTLGLVAQVGAAALMPVAAIFLVREGNLEIAGYLAYSQGIFSLVYNLTSFGLRPYLAIQGLNDQDYPLHLLLRLGGCLIILAVWSVTAVLDLLPALLSFGVAVLRVGDAVQDLSLGIRQATQKTSGILAGYTADVLLRLAVFGGLLVIVRWLWGSALYGFVGGAVGAAVWVGAVEGRRLRSRGWHGIALTRVPAILAGASPYAFSTMGVALIMVLPRLLAERYYAGDSFGAAGVALMTVTLFGMAFYTSWVRANVEFRNRGFDSRISRRFLGELGLVLLLLVGGLNVVVPVLGWIYAVQDQQQLSLIFGIGAAALVLNASIGVMNLFKVSRRPGSEALVYLCGALGMVAGWAAGLQFITVLYGSSAVLLTAGVYFWRRIGSV